MRRFLLPLLAVAVLAGCSSASNSTATPAKLEAAAATIAATVTTPRSPTPTPTPSPVPTATLAPTPNDGLVHVQCSKEQAAETLDKLIGPYGAFLDTYRVANRTARISLAPIITQMQQQKRDVAAIIFPPCAVVARDAVVRDMNDTINIVLAFLGEEDTTAPYAKSAASVAETIRLVSELRAQADK
jgi:uncharacterized membrane protein YqaE (UPF0057 family)